MEMQQRLLAGAIGAVGAMVCASAMAQDYEAPRTIHGQPDLQGIWTNQTLTPLTRDPEFGETLALSREQAAELEGGHQEFLEAEFAPSDPDRAAGAGAQGGDDGDTNDGYNEFWKEVGERLLVIDGEPRSSIIVDPPDGQIPYAGDPRARFRRPEGAPGRNDGPEGRPLSERCLISFGTHSGPPMLPVMYNNNYQIVQTGDHVMILAEMIHDARIIPLGEDAEPRPELEKWMGDSVGHWEGDTLVVETTGFHPQHSIFGATPDVEVTERFERISDQSILYTFTVEDPEVFSQPWTGELLFNSRPQAERMYEYACHEGNYALPGVLAGARREEADAR